MAKNGQYSTRQRIVMQAVMWAVLGATVGMAAMLSRARNRAFEVTLAPPVAAAGMQVRLPQGWAVSPRPGFTGIVLLAKDAGSGRIVIIRRERFAEIVPPAQYLVMRGLVPLSFLMPAAMEQLGAGEAQLAGYPGLLAIHLSQTNAGPTRRALVCAILPTREAITVEVRAAGAMVNTGEDIIARQVAAAIRLDNIPMPPGEGRASQINLPGVGGEIAVSLPQELIVMPAVDPLRVDRAAVLPRADQWVVAHLIPCLFDPKSDPKAILNLLWQGSSPQDWAFAKVTASGPRQWRVDPPTTDAPFPSVAHLIAADNGEALLVLLEGSLESAGAFDDVSVSILKSVQFPAAADHRPLWKAGTDQAARWAESGIAKLLPPAETRLFAWMEAGVERPVGWTSESPSAGNAWQRTMEYRPSSGVRGRVVHRFSGDENLRDYRSLMVTANAAPGAPLQQSVSHEITVADGQINEKLLVEGVAIKSSTPAPTAYVPGGWIPLLMPHLADSPPMLLRTDSFLQYEDLSGSDLLTLIIRCEDSPQADSDRAVTVRVNGSGRISRWHVTSDGRAGTIDMADQTQWVRRSESDPEAPTQDAE